MTRNSINLTVLMVLVVNSGWGFDLFSMRYFPLILHFVLQPPEINFHFQSLSPFWEIQSLWGNSGRAVARCQSMTLVFSRASMEVNCVYKSKRACRGKEKYSKFPKVVCVCMYVCKSTDLMYDVDVRLFRQLQRSTYISTYDLCKSTPVVPYFKTWNKF